jgi:hypothetical protein
MISGRCRYIAKCELIFATDHDLCPTDTSTDRLLLLLLHANGLTKCAVWQASDISLTDRSEACFTSRLSSVAEQHISVASQCCLRV